MTGRVHPAVWRRPTGAPVSPPAPRGRPCTVADDVRQDLRHHQRRRRAARGGARRRRSRVRVRAEPPPGPLERGAGDRAAAARRRPLSACSATSDASGSSRCALAGLTGASSTAASTPSEVRWIADRVPFVIQAFAAGDPALADAADGPADVGARSTPPTRLGPGVRLALAEGAPRGAGDPRWRARRGQRRRGDPAGPAVGRRRVDRSGDRAGSAARTRRAAAVHRGGPPGRRGRGPRRLDARARAGPPLRLADGRARPTARRFGRVCHPDP